MRATKYTAFLKSALTEKNPFYSTEEVLKWLRTRNEEVQVRVKRIKFSEMEQWSFDPATGNLVHKSGSFFLIEGIRVKTNWGTVNNWTQPIINQPEIGFLGIITKEFDGVMYFLMQAKIEPGNINHVQLSPTLQATKSNYTQIHAGKKPLYLEYFLNTNRSGVLLDQLQSEQGARFLKKRNRNIIISVTGDIPVYEDFRWLTLGQINKMVQQNSTVNMDTRTVISGIPFSAYNGTQIDLDEISEGHRSSSFQSNMLVSLLNEDSPLYTFDDLISWLTNLKTKYDLLVEKIPLNEVQGWIKTDQDIHHQKNKYFRVIPVSVEIGNREVRRWDQPLIEPAQEGLCAFIIKKVNGVYHFIVQGKLECGNFDVIEIAPTVQCITGNYKTGTIEEIPFLSEVLNTPAERIRCDTYQSEEGGRFYREQNRSLIVEMDENEKVELPENYTWMTFGQLKTFLRFNNYLNIQARSLLTLIEFIL